MTHGKNRSKFRKIRIATCIIIIIIVLFIVCLKILFKKNTKNTENSKNEFTLYDSLIADYVKQSENGTKINISPKINQDMKLNELDIKNIQLTCKNGITTLLADVLNNTKAEFDKKFEEKARTERKVFSFGSGVVTTNAPVETSEEIEENNDDENIDVNV